MNPKYRDTIKIYVSMNRNYCTAFCLWGGIGREYAIGETLAAGRLRIAYVMSVTGHNGFFRQHLIQRSSNIVQYSNSCFTI